MKGRKGMEVKRPDSGKNKLEMDDIHYSISSFEERVLIRGVSWVNLLGAS